MEIPFDFNDVPNGWELCFVNECPMKDQCMRYYAGQHVPPTKMVARTVLPIALQEGECRFFKEIRTIKAVRGWGDFFGSVRRNDYHRLLNSMINYFGSETYYYRYKRGEYLLLPEQQEWIAHLFEEAGYPDAVHFEKFVYTYDFSDRR